MTTRHYFKKRNKDLEESADAYELTVAVHISEYSMFLSILYLQNTLAASAGIILTPCTSPHRWIYTFEMWHGQRHFDILTLGIFLTPKHIHKHIHPLYKCRHVGLHYTITKILFFEILVRTKVIIRVCMGYMYIIGE